MFIFQDISFLLYTNTEKHSCVEHSLGIMSKTFGTFNILFHANTLCKQSHLFC